MEVKEDKVDKFLELIPGLFFGSQVDSAWLGLFVSSDRRSLNTPFHCV